MIHPWRQAWLVTGRVWLESWVKIVIEYYEHVKHGVTSYKAASTELHCGSMSSVSRKGCYQIAYKLYALKGVSLRMSSWSCLWRHLRGHIFQVPGIAGAPGTIVFIWWMPRTFYVIVILWSVLFALTRNAQEQIYILSLWIEPVATTNCRCSL